MKTTNALRALLLIALLTGLRARLITPAAAQSDPTPADVLIALTGALDDAACAPSALADDLHAAFAEVNAAATVAYTDAGQIVLPERQVFDHALLILVEPCRTASCAARVSFWVNTPPTLAPLPADLQTEIANLHPLALTLQTCTPATDALTQQIALALGGGALDHCQTALPYFDAAQEALTDPPDGVTVTFPHAFDFYTARCQWREREYAATVDTLQQTRPSLLAADPPWTLPLLWDAYIADGLAQQFAFDRALAWDDRNLLIASAHADPADPLAERLLAALYLLRGQHRLYLYEWDTVLADYNAALALENAPPHGYYYRGLLYYTQNEREAALRDFQHYLALTPDPAAAPAPQAAAYAAELEALLAADHAE